MTRSSCETAGCLGRLGENLVALGDDDIHLDAVVDGTHVVVALSVVEGSDDGGVGALHDADDAAFGASLAGVRGDLDEDLVAVHGLAGFKGRDEDIALEALAHLAVQRADEAEAVAVHGERADDEIAIDGRLGDGITVAGDQDELAADDKIGEERFELLALAATQREFADELLVSGGALGLVFDVLQQIAFRDHSWLERWYRVRGRSANRDGGG